MHSHFALEIDGERQPVRDWRTLFDQLVAARGHRVEVVEITKHHQRGEEIEVGRWVIGAGKGH